MKPPFDEIFRVMLSDIHAKLNLWNTTTTTDKKLYELNTTKAQAIKI